MDYYIIPKKGTNLEIVNENEEKMINRLKKYMELLGRAACLKQKD